MPTYPVERAKDILLRPFSLGGLALPNRVVMAPMTREFSPGGVPGDDVAQYYARRAAAGVGLIITEGTYVGHDSAGNSARVPHFYGDEALGGWSAVAEAVHQAGGRIMPQLWHVGMDRTVGNPPVPDAPRIGPSGVALDGTKLGREMTQADIDNVVAAYASAATAAEALGFDGVEIHGGHGYLIDQFLWPHTNRRTDAYGADVAGRTRFAAEVVAACREAVSGDFPISFRFSQWKVNHYQARIAETPQELETMLGLLADAGTDAFHCSTRRFNLPEFEGSDLNLAGWAKKLSGKPAVTVGSVGLSNEFLQVFQGEQATVTGIGELLDRMERDEFDLVAVGRPLLGDPEWLEKVLAGRVDELTPFHVGLVGSLH
ncbi:oxidoreductase [Streptomyces capoamus]|uniref:Oxidoreductase n=1 Tax=Streptomyces capoamus TaxID=68183 RepID=A0A919KFL8_9ACTN|nr:NADH:flavin oxidoreductase [Streptomyces capoamus]GGW13330.1 oxidoreductase [Streptomyces libani subsp. rufus]GHG74755.1 oxidoreductase [Streptomyces capoamus]